MKFPFFCSLPLSYSNQRTRRTHLFVTFLCSLTTKGHESTAHWDNFTLQSWAKGLSCLAQKKLSFSPFGVRGVFCIDKGHVYDIYVSLHIGSMSL